MRILLIAAFLIPSSLALAEETIPIPKKRPKILSVSPAYIEELKNRGKTSVDVPSPEMLIEANKTESILSELAPTAGNQENIPVPLQKPISEADKEATEQNKQTSEQRLVSFSLPPQTIKLDKNLKSFLTNHVLNLFKNNTALKLDIQAYATSSEQEQSSDVRIALARALEVRKFLIANNIKPNRIKLSPLGQDHNNNSDDRIDLVFIDSKAENL